MVSMSIKDIIIEIEDSAHKFNLNLIVFKNSDFENPIKCKTVMDILLHADDCSEMNVVLQRKSLFKNLKHAATRSVMWWSFKNGDIVATSQHLKTGTTYGNAGSIYSCVSSALKTG